MGIFNFSLPIGWNEVATIATVLAVLVALWANLDAKKQLKSALAMQEQSKNVELFGRRIEILKNFKNTGNLPELETRLLFGSKTERDYLELEEYNRKLSIEDKRRERFLWLDSESNEYGTKDHPIRDRIRSFQAEIERTGGAMEVLEEYKQFCEEHTLKEKYAYKDEADDEYNFYEIEKNIQELKEEIQQKKEAIEREMEDFISRSIADIETKR
jgi:hypothetical protein